MYIFKSPIVGSPRPLARARRASVAIGQGGGGFRKWGRSGSGGNYYQKTSMVTLHDGMKYIPQRACTRVRKGISCNSLGLMVLVLFLLEIRLRYYCTAVFRELKGYIFHCFYDAHHLLALLCYIFGVISCHPTAN